MWCLHPLRATMRQNTPNMFEEEALAMERSRGLTLRTVYLYVATLVGLGLIIAGGVQLFELILKATILTQADAEERSYAKQPPMPYGIFEADPAKEISELTELTAEQQVMLERWLVDYESWSERQEGLDVVAARRESRAATALALLLVGIPLYLYHWLTIRRELTRSALPPAGTSG